MKKGILTFWLCALFILGGCEAITFSPEEEHFVDLLPSPLTISLNFTDPSDTLVVWGQTEFSYQLDLDDREFEEVRFYVDSIFIGSSQSSRNFSFSSQAFPDGPHTLGIEIWVHSGSGSLADRLGAEFALALIEQPIYINNALPDPIVDISAERLGGGMQLSWPAYLENNFQSYKIYKIYDSGAERLEATISNPTDTSWSHPHFIGGEQLSYRVDLCATGVQARGATVNFSDVIPQLIDISTDDDGNTTFRWNRCKYSSAFAGYRIELDSTGGWQPFASILNINDTTLSNHVIPFGVHKEYRLVTLSSNPLYNLYGDQRNGWAGERIPEYDRLQYVEETNSIYLLDQVKAWRYDASTMTEEASATLRYSVVAYDGSRAFAVEDRYGTELLEIDPMTFTTINSYATEDYVVTPAHMWELGLASTDKVFARASEYRDPTWFAVRSIMMTPGDLNSGSEIRGVSNWAPDLLFFSKNGHYAVLSDYYATLYDVSQNEFTEMRRIDTPQHFTFLGDGEEYVTAVNGSIEIFSTSDSSIVTSFSIPEDLRGLQIDPGSGFLGGYGHDTATYYVYDLVNQTVVHQISVAKLYHDEYAFANSTLFSPFGYYIRVN